MELFEKTLDSKKIFDGRILHIVLDEVELPDGKGQRGRLSIIRAEYALPLLMRTIIFLL